jgi:acetamidase/formamidase
MARHHLDEATVHHAWDADEPTRLVVASGDEVELDLRMAAHGQLDFRSRAEDVQWDFDVLYHLAGPIEVEGAKPGGTLRVDVLELTPGDWGWTGVLPGLGLLPEDFPDPVLRTFDLRQGGPARLTDVVQIPLRPFLGTMGVDPGLGGSLSAFPPHRGGGNLDTRQLEEGTALLLPTWVDGARFSCGDPHASQGDGEVCVSAIECPMHAVLRLTYVDKPIAAPSFHTPPTRRSNLFQVAGVHTTLGIADDLHEGARAAVRAMIEWLGTDHDLAPEDAYVLCSICADLRIHQIVDAGVFSVGCSLPLAVLASS